MPPATDGRAEGGAGEVSLRRARSNLGEEAGEEATPKRDAVPPATAGSQVPGTGLARHSRSRASTVAT